MRGVGARVAAVSLCTHAHMHTRAHTHTLAHAQSEQRTVKDKTQSVSAPCAVNMQIYTLVVDMSLYYAPNHARLSRSNTHPSLFA